MLRPTSLTACISVAALLAVIAAGPVYAQSAPDSAAEAQREPAQQVEAQQDTDDADADRMAREGEVADRLAQEAEAAERRAAEAKEAETAAPAAAAAAPAPEAAPAAAPAAVAAAEAEPVVLEARQRLAASKVADVTAAERTALADFYKGRQAPVWVTATGFTPRARHAMAEIAQADDWGLEAKAFALPALSPGDTDAGALADAEIKLSVAVLKYARHARGGRLEPSQVSRNFDQKLSLRDPKVVLETVAGLDTPGSYLRALHPKHSQFQLLRQALLKARGTAEAPEGEAVVRLPTSGPVLKLGVQHPDVALLRQRLKMAAASGPENVFDDEVLDAVKAYQRKSGMRDDGVIGSATRASLNGSDRASLFGNEETRLLVNMERWRWVPEDLGEFHVWDNVPEYQARVVKDNRVIHQARIIVGRLETQTTIFSANMRYIVFGPEWGVPDSIKVKEILPHLRPKQEQGLFGFGGTVTDTRVLDRQNMRVVYNGKTVDASQIDWNQVDIRKFYFIQAAGPGNALGAVKFRFPNKHDIYMHDTPMRDLFNRPVRAFSHGCVRVQNPGRLAEVLLEEDKGWSAGRVRDMMERGGNVEVTLSKQIPVHITYFTSVVSDDGKVSSFPDIYGHDRRVAAALGGRPMPLEQSQSPSVSQDGPPAAANKKEARRPPGYQKQAQEDLFNGLFGN